MNVTVPRPAHFEIGLGPSLETVDKVSVRFHGRKLLYFGGCDYFRLSCDASLRKAIQRGLDRFGLNVAASRVTSGNHALYVQAEKSLERFFQVESATLTSSGYFPGLIVGQALRGQVSLALVEQQAHSCLAELVQGLDCPVREFRRGDVRQVRQLLKSSRRPARPVVLSEGVRSNDGTIAPLDRYLTVLPSRGILVVDDAHGVGVLGDHGRGTLEAQGIDSRAVVQVVTFSKAFGVYGGAVLGPAWLRAKIIAGSRAFAGNTPLPLPLVAGLLAALKRIERGAGIRRRLHAHSEFVKSTLRAAGATVPENTVPIIVLDAASEAAERQTRQVLSSHGIYPNFIRYPGLAERGCFRFAISSAHAPAHLRRLVNALVPLVRSGRLRALDPVRR